jgi:hypothetical protein
MHALHSGFSMYLNNDLPRIAMQDPDTLLRRQRVSELDYSVHHHGRHFPWRSSGPGQGGPVATEGCLWLVEMVK